MRQATNSLHDVVNHDLQRSIAVDFDANILAVVRQNWYGVLVITLQPLRQRVLGVVRALVQRLAGDVVLALHLGHELGVAHVVAAA